MIRLPLSQRSMALLLIVSAFAIGIEAVRAADPAPARTQSVSIRMFAFAPQVLTVSPGTTVTWTNADEDPHTVTATDRSFRSGALDTDDTFRFTFTRPGDYTYFCSLHPRMTGRIIVKAG
jgi:plastocyanin